MKYDLKRLDIGDRLTTVFLPVLGKSIIFVGLF